MPTWTHGPTADALSAASKALGDIMLEMQRRRLMARGAYKMSTPAYDKAVASALTDEQIGSLAAIAFEASVMRLAEIGYPDCTVFVCNPTDEP